MTDQSDDIMFRIISSLGRLEENTKNADRSREMSRQEVHELRTSVVELTKSVRELNARIHPVEVLSEDYQRTRNRIVTVLVMLGIGNLGLGTVGGALATKWLGGN